jgi:hypothetical protein
MGWFSEDDHETAHNQGQADGAKAGKTGESHYTGTLFSGRSWAEQQSYNKGYEQGKSSTEDNK